MKLLTIIALLFGLPIPIDGQDRLAEQLRKGIVQEDVNGSVDKAIPIYQAIVAQYDQDRQAAATATFRLGECYRKAGRKDQAVAAYQRVVREFGDQAALVESSRKQLQGYGVAEPKTARESAEVQYLRQELAKARRAREEAFAEQSRVREQAQRPADVDGESPDVARVRLAAAQQRLADMRQQFEAGTASREVLLALTADYEIAQRRYEELLLKQETQQKLTQQTMKSVEAEIVLVEQRIKDVEKRVQAGVVQASDPELLQLRRDLLSLQRKLAELRAAAR